MTSRKRALFITAAIILSGTFMVSILFLLTVKTSQTRQTDMGQKEQAQMKFTEGTFPQKLQELMDNSKSDFAGTEGSYYILKNNEMVIAYNREANTFIVTANGKSNEQAASTGYQAYFTGLGVEDLGKLNIIFRVRGQW